MTSKLIEELTKLLEDYKFLSPSLRIWFEKGELRFFLTNAPPRRRENDRFYSTSPFNKQKRKCPQSPINPPENLRGVPTRETTHHVSVTSCDRYPEQDVPPDPGVVSVDLHPHLDMKLNDNSVYHLEPETTMINPDVELSNRFSSLDPDFDDIQLNDHREDSNLNLKSNGYPVQNSNVKQIYSFCHDSLCSLCKTHSLTKPLKYSCDCSFFSSCNSVHWHVETDDCVRVELQPDDSKQYENAPDR